MLYTYMHISYYMLYIYIYIYMDICRGSPCMRTKCENYHAANVSGLVTERTESLNSGLWVLLFRNFFTMPGQYRCVLWPLCDIATIVTTTKNAASGLAGFKSDTNIWLEVWQVFWINIGRVCIRHFLGLKIAVDHLFHVMQEFVFFWGVVISGMDSVQVCERTLNVHVVVFVSLPVHGCNPSEFTETRKKKMQVVITIFADIIDFAKRL